MSKVVFLHHRGTRCAIPAAQVTRIGDDIEDVTPLELFDGVTDAAGPSSDRRLLVRTPEGERVVSCEQARLGTLEDATLFELPELLRRTFRRPHIVGVADTRDGLVWLIDLLELPGEAHEQ